MAKGSDKDEELEALYKRFEALLLGDSLSEKEKESLREKLLKIIYGSEEGVVK